MRRQEADQLTSHLIRIKRLRIGKFSRGGRVDEYEWGE